VINKGEKVGTSFKKRTKRDTSRCKKYGKKRGHKEETDEKTGRITMGSTITGALSTG